MANSKITIPKIGNSLGFILPREAALALGVEEGDELTLTDSPEGLRITRYDPEFEQKMKQVDSIVKRYKNALRELAK